MARKRTKQAQSQAQVVNIRLGTLRQDKKDLTKDNKKLEKANEKLRKDVLNALAAKAKAATAASGARARATAKTQDLTARIGERNAAQTLNSTLNKQLGAATQKGDQYETLYTQVMGQLNTATGERDQLKLDVAVERAGRTADGRVAEAEKAKDLAVLEKTKDVAYAQKDGELRVEQANRTADGRVATADRAKELAEQKETYEKQVAGKDADLRVEKVERTADGRVATADKAKELAEKEKTYEVQSANDKVSYVKRFYQAALAAVAGAAILAAGTFYLGRASTPTLEQKVEKVDKKTDAPADKPADTPKTDKTDGAKTVEKPADTPKVEPTPGPFKYHALEARVGDSWYVVEPSTTASEYRIIVKNKRLDGSLEVYASKTIQQDAIHGNEGYLSLVKRLLAQDGRADYDPHEYGKLVNKLPSLDTKTGGDTETITSADVKAAHVKVSGGLKAVLGE